MTDSGSGNDGGVEAQIVHAALCMRPEYTLGHTISQEHISMLSISLLGGLSMFQQLVCGWHRHGAKSNQSYQS